MFCAELAFVTSVEERKQQGRETGPPTRVSHNDCASLSRATRCGPQGISPQDFGALVHDLGDPSLPKGY
jgi:hypothetical protein